MRSIVTGGRGFIGSVLVKKLIDQGDEVIVIDNNSSTNGAGTIYGKATYHVLDLNNFEDILPLFEGVDRVFHLAAYVSIEFCKKYPREAGLNNSNTTLNVLECCRLKNVKTFVFSSTSAVYKENPLHLTYKEEDETCPLNLYSASKLYGEDLCRIYWELYGIKTTILRYFNVYGTTSSANQYAAVIIKFLNNLKEGLPLNIYGEGYQTRDFIHVDDVADINIKASFKEMEKYGQVFNVGTGNSITINQLASYISNNVVYSEPKIGELKFSCADISKTLKTFDWKPQTTIENWLKTIIKTND